MVPYWEIGRGARSLLEKWAPGGGGVREDMYVCTISLLLILTTCGNVVHRIQGTLLRVLVFSSPFRCFDSTIFFISKSGDLSFAIARARPSDSFLWKPAAALRARLLTQHYVCHAWCHLPGATPRTSYRNISIPTYKIYWEQ